MGPDISGISFHFGENTVFLFVCLFVCVFTVCRFDLTTPPEIWFAWTVRQTGQTCRGTYLNMSLAWSGVGTSSEFDGVVLIKMSKVKIKRAFSPRKLTCPLKLHGLVQMHISY